MSEGLVRRREDDAGTRRLVLAFDAGCCSCSDLARRIGEQVSDKLELLSLEHPLVQEWRRRALGEDAPWAPTLIETKGTTVRAWTGSGLAIHLSRSLGPVRTWRVMQILGESAAVTASERLGENPTGALVRAVSRREFLKGAGGVVAGAAILAGFGGLPLAMAAANGRNGNYTHRSVTGTERDTLIADLLNNNSRFNSLFRYFVTKGFNPRKDMAQAVSVTISNGATSRTFYDLKVPYERQGQEYPVLFITFENSGEKSAENTGVAVFKRIRNTNRASSADLYRVTQAHAHGPGHKHRHDHKTGQNSVALQQTVQGPFPSNNSPAAQGRPSSASQVTPQDANSRLCKICEFVQSTITTVGCDLGSAIICGFVCFSATVVAVFPECGDVCGTVYDALCQGINSVREDIVCRPFCGSGQY